MQTDSLEKALEARARRVAKKVGLIATKSRQGYHCDNHLLFRLIDSSTNTVVEGEKYDWSAEMVIELCEELLQEQRQPA